MKTRLQTVYKYFSGNMRSATATIATSVTLLATNLSTDRDANYTEMVGSSYMLDLYGRGMDICFRALFDEEFEYIDTMNLEQMVMHFVEQSKVVMNTNDIKLNMHISNPTVINGNVHEIRTLTDIILNEILLQTSSNLSVKLINNKLTITSDTFSSVPEVWTIFKWLLAKHNVTFNYAAHLCTLKY